MPTPATNRPPAAVSFLPGGTGVSAARNAVTPMQRWAIEARSQGLSRRQSARLLRVTPQAIKKRLSRARKRLLSRLPEARRQRYLAALNAGGRRHVIRPLSLDCSRGNI